MKRIPLWSKRANKKLIDIGMTKKELAEKIHVNYNQLCNVMSGTVVNDTVQAAICAYLDV